MYRESKQGSVVSSPYITPSLELDKERLAHYPLQQGTLFYIKHSSRRMVSTISPHIVVVSFFWRCSYCKAIFFTGEKGIFHRDDVGRNRYLGNRQLHYFHENCYLLPDDSVSCSRRQLIRCSLCQSECVFFVTEQIES